MLPCSKTFGLLFTLLLIACQSSPSLKKDSIRATGQGKPNVQETNPVNRKIQACMAAEFKAREALTAKIHSDRSISLARIYQKDYNSDEICTVTLVLD